MDAVALIDWSPAAQVALLGAVLALGPLGWIAWRHRHATAPQRLRALTLLTLFLTFDLVLFGAFTRLTDSGLGCPDWPGCYGNASPLGAHDEIHAAQSALPSGPVTHGKAWVEMVHRYLATGVGALITAMTASAWWLRLRGARDAPSPWWPTATLAWVIVQGAFGALTVTMKLYPAIVTLHLLGGLGLLVLLSLQAQGQAGPPIAAGAGLRRLAAAVSALVLLQILLGGWVSTNYAVLACSDFPTCQGAWWPPMDFGHGFTLRRPLGETATGQFLPFEALTAIHVTHRAMAMVVLAAMAALGWRLARSPDAGARRIALGLALLAAWQLASGLSNVVLGWPIVAALAHSGGAAACVVLLATLLARLHRGTASPTPPRTAARTGAGPAAVAEVRS